MRWCKKIAIAAALAFAGAPAGVRAGPLDPPAGPVAPTGKTLTEVEPRTPVETLAGDASSQYLISQSGSYYLTGNLNGVSGKVGIRITASNVTLDLSGFALIGVADSLSGIIIQQPPPITSGLQNVTVRNGTIRGWGGSGLVASFALTNGRLESLALSFNGGYGMRLNGRGFTVRDCIARSNVLDGIDLGLVGGFGGPSSVIGRCVATGNGGAGIRAADGSVIIACAAKSNALQGISAGPGCSVADCTADSNTGVGIDTLDGCTVVGCTTVDNADRGIRTGTGCAIVSCTSRRNGSGGTFRPGIDAGPYYSGASEIGGCAVADCAAEANQDWGLAVRGGSAVTRCQTVVGGGIAVSSGCTLSDCSTLSSSGIGIATAANCVAVRCTATNSTGSGLTTGGTVAHPGDGSLVAHCTAYLSGLNGFSLSSGDFIIGCESTGTGTTTWGIAALGWSYVLSNRCRGNIDGIGYRDNDSRFEANHVLFNGAGFDTTGFTADNLFVRNSSTNNPTAHYNVPAGNRPLTVTNNPTTAKAWDNFTMP